MNPCVIAPYVVSLAPCVVYVTLVIAVSSTIVLCFVSPGSGTPHVVIPCIAVPSRVVVPCVAVLRVVTPCCVIPCAVAPCIVSLALLPHSRCSSAVIILPLSLLVLRLGIGK